MLFWAVCVAFSFSVASHFIVHFVSLPILSYLFLFQKRRNEEKRNMELCINYPPKKKFGSFKMEGPQRFSDVTVSIFLLISFSANGFSFAFVETLLPSFDVFVFNTVLCACKMYEIAIFQAIVPLFSSFLFCFFCSTNKNKKKTNKNFTVRLGKPFPIESGKIESR